MVVGHPRQIYKKMSQMSTELQHDISSGFLCPDQHKTFEFLFQGGYYCVSIFPELSMNSETTADKIRHEFHIVIYNPNNRQRLADDLGNGAPFCRMLISEGEPLKLNVMISRDSQITNSSNNKVYYKVTLFSFDLKTYYIVSESHQIITTPEVYWMYN
jgi:hypothetical protein